MPLLTELQPLGICFPTAQAVRLVRASLAATRPGVDEHVTALRALSAVS